MAEHEIARASTTEGLPVAPTLGPTLAAAHVPQRMALVDLRVILISALAVVIAFVAALVARGLSDAERSYRIMLRGRVPSWNLRERHMAETLEALFARLDLRRFYLPLRDGTAAAALDEPRLERAIGVVYRPETERQNHYFHAHLPAQFDAVLHFDETRAVEPLERTGAWETGEIPETFPSGI